MSVMRWNCTAGFLVSAGVPLCAMELAEPTRADLFSVRGRLEQNLGYDTNPTLGDQRSAGRTHAIQPDNFSHTRASLNVACRDVPLAIRGSADCLEYFHEHKFSNDTVEGEFSAPWQATDSTTLTPLALLEHEWVGHKDYQNTTKAAMHWEQEWDSAWTTEVTPSFSHIAYVAPNQGLSGHDRDVQSAITWWVPGQQLLASLEGNASLTSFVADNQKNDYQAGTIGIDADWRLPLKFDLETSAIWGSTDYDQADANGVYRLDHLFTVAVILQRPVLTWLAVTLGVEHTSLNSNIPGNSYIQTQEYLGFIAHGF